MLLAGGGLGPNELFYYPSLLVDLDRVDRRVAAVIPLFSGHFIERATELVDPVMENIGKTHQHRQLQSLLHQFSGQFRQIDIVTRAATVGTDQHVPLGRDVDITVTPVRNVVNLLGVGAGKFNHGSVPVVRRAAGHASMQSHIVRVHQRC